MPLNALLVQTPVVGPDGRITEPWRVYFRDQATTIDTSTVKTVSPLVLTGQNASISTTAIPTDALASGLYRLTYYARITGPAGVSSSLTPTFAWTDGSASCTVSGAAITGNTISSTGTGTYLVQIDQATPISYSTTYASNPAAAMTYALAIVLETVGE